VLLDADPVRGLSISRERILCYLPRRPHPLLSDMKLAKKGRLSEPSLFHTCANRQTVVESESYW